MLYIHQIVNGIWMMDQAYAMNYLPAVTSFMKGENHLLQTSREDEIRHDKHTGVCFLSLDRKLHPVSDYGGWSSPEQAPVNSIAVIEITGAITKYDQYCGPAGMATKSNLLERCYANDKIEGICLKIDSGGGQGMAMRLLAETISKRNKGVVAFVDDMACSAAYGISAACDKIVANSNMANIGSIGTYCTILDFTAQLKMQGIDLIEVYATDSKDKNNIFREALKGNKEPLQAYVDTFNETFLQHIESSRSDLLKSDRKVWGTGKEFFGDKALEIGLIDAIDSFSNILYHFS
ncbi:MAG: signal peptidase [Bacteroidales bacterium 45-6]|nr:MAG: signal peptidase [Bacteroidales bacterium 45-6]